MTLTEKAAQTPLFAGHEKDEIEKILRCTGAVISRYEPGERILSFGDRIARVGIVLSGSADTVRTDVFGKPCTLTSVGTDSLFGLAAAVPETGKGITVAAGAEGCEALLIDAKVLLWGCEDYCGSHKKLMYNLLTVLSEDRIGLLRQLRYVSRHSLREKIAAYLTDCYEKAGNHEFTLSEDRKGMAELLFADRTALSAELSRMKSDGLIDYRKNRFTLREKFFDIQKNN